MKKFLFFVFIFILSFQPNQVFAKEIRFIQVTDTHLTQNNAIYLEYFVNDINKNYKNIDFIVFTGDNLEKPRVDDLELFLNIVKKLKIKTYILMGNHDLYKSQKLTSKIYMQHVRKKLGSYHSAEANYTFKKGNVVFITMNGVKEVLPGSNGYYKENELKWLDKELTKNKNKKVVIIQHFPLLDAPNSAHSTHKKNEYLEVLNKHNNVIAIVSGHYHINMEENENNIYHIVTPNFSNNSFYKIITIDDNNSIYTFLIDNENKK